MPTYQENGETAIRGFVQICIKSRIAIFQTALLFHEILTKTI